MDNKYLEKMAAGQIIDMAAGPNGMINKITHVGYQVPAMPGTPMPKMKNITPMRPGLSRGLKIGGGLLAGGLVARALMHKKDQDQPGQLKAAGLGKFVKDLTGENLRMARLKGNVTRAVNAASDIEHATHADMMKQYSGYEHLTAKEMGRHKDRMAGIDDVRDTLNSHANVGGTRRTLDEVVTVMNDQHKARRNTAIGAGVVGTGLAVNSQRKK